MRDRAFWIVLFACALFVALFVVRDFSGPLLHTIDPGMYQFTSFYFAENIHWWPFPRLDLETDWSLYPYGINHVFLHWAFERDLLVAALTSLFGIGPWWQIYFIVSLSLGAGGVFLVLRQTVDRRAALAVAFGATFFNFYAIAKFPLHQPLSTIHWLLIGVALDYLLVRRHLQAEEPPTLTLWLWRLLVLVLSLGHDLGYVAGYGITSFLLATLWIGANRLGSLKDFDLGDAFRRLIGSLRANGRDRWLVLAVLIALWLYFPLALQIARTANRFDFSEVRMPAEWEHPLRLFVPLIPGLDPFDGETRLREWFGDVTETWTFHFAPGLTFVALGLGGLASSRRHLRIAAPFAILLLLLVTFNPFSFPWLRELPWFAFARSPGRATLLFPLLFGLLALGLRLPATRSRWRWPALALLAALGCAETATAFERIGRARRAFPATALEGELATLARTIRDTPGEALLEFPFAVAPSHTNLDAYFSRLAGSSGLAILHGKKSVGYYTTRLHPRQLDEVLLAGWAEMMLPSQAYAEMDRARRPFSAEEWNFFEEFLRANDFSGVLLYTDLLPAEAVEQFHRRLGPAVANASGPDRAGRIEFIPKPASLRSGLDGERGRKLRLVRFPTRLDLGRTVLLDRREGEDFLFEGWSSIPRNRAIEGRRATIRFLLAHRDDLRIELETRSWGPQRLEVSVNGTPAFRAVLDPDRTVELGFDVPASSLRESNEIVFDAPDARPVIGPKGRILLGPSVVSLRLVVPTRPPRFFEDDFETGGFAAWSVATGSP
jgi:hypothetical protein